MIGYPKPQFKKQKKAKNNPKPTENDICYYTGQPYATTHEVFEGNGKRQISIENHYQIKINQSDHNKIQKATEPYWEAEDTRWKIYYQTKFELERIAEGMTVEQARTVWIQLIGKSYI